MASYATEWEREYDERTEESVEAAAEVALKANPRLWYATHHPVEGKATAWNPDGYPELPGPPVPKVPTQNNV